MSIDAALKELKKAKANVKSKAVKRDEILKKYTKRMAKNMQESMTQEKDRAESDFSAAVDKFEAAKRAVFTVVESKVAKIEKTLTAEKKATAAKVKKMKQNLEGTAEKKIAAVKAEKKR